MALISKLDRSGSVALEREIQLRTRGQPSLAAAAQAYTALVYGSFTESLVLARMFGSVPFRGLPPGSQDFVRGLATTTGVSGQLGDQTLVLSLLGTSGVEPAWNDRQQSRGHVGIPLTSAAFIDEIPMMSRLLRQLGVDLGWVEKGDTGIVGRTLGASGGCFYVEDAAQEVDVRGRKVIAAQEFVRQHGVQTVFGVGGGYVGSGIFVVAIFFCRERVPQSVAEGFMGHMTRFKVPTVDLVKADRIFG